MTKKIYTAYSSDEFIKYLLYRLAAFAGLIYAVFHFKENPVATYLIGGFCLLGLFIFGNEKIVVYSDKIIQTDNSFLSLLFNSKKTFVEVGKIKTSYTASQPDSNLIEEAAVSILSKLIRFNKTTDRTFTTIYFELINGETTELVSELEKGTINKIIEITNNLINKQGSSAA